MGVQELGTVPEFVVQIGTSEEWKRQSEVYGTIIKKIK
jgi:hypothetical protein